MFKKKLPNAGRPRDAILNEMRALTRSDPDFKNGRTWSLVYYLDDAFDAFLKEAHGIFFSANGLNPMAFQSLKRFESDVVRMTATLLNGDDNVCGTMTNGGTESCLLALKTYRDLAKATRPHIKKPEIILPESAHVAWEKGAQYFGLKTIYVPLDDMYRVNVNKVEKRINRRTVMILGSAPQYPHGAIDPIEDLSILAQKHDLPLHVDACVGGYLLPFIEKLGMPVTPFDFRVPGVSSISADTHKYGYSAKGASTILYRHTGYLKHQLFVYENWPGGIFGSSGILGTRPGGSIAAAWAAMQAMGESGYLEKARVIMDTTRRLIDGINKIDGLEVLGDPPMSLFAYRSTDKKINIFAVGDRMASAGWHIDRQHKPPCLHAMVTPLHATVTDRYLSDLAAAVEHVRNHPDLATHGSAPMYGMIAHIPFRGMIRKEVTNMLLNMYGPKGEMPDLNSSDSSNDGNRVTSIKSSRITKLARTYLKLKDKWFT